MFASSSLIAARERAAVLALMTRRDVPWNRLAGAIEEEGSALRLLSSSETQTPSTLFPVDSGQVTIDQMEGYVHALEDEGITVTTVLDDLYPPNLRMVHDRPAALFIRGELVERDERSVAVVGTRRASTPGVAAAKSVVADLVAADYVVVSGLAAGIDATAHQAALDAGGRTVAVIGTGLRHSFPKANAALQARIAAESAVVSQFWPSQEPRRWTFPQRNAVMSGFARATVVIEAGDTSGARMQARLASEHGRPVFLHRLVMAHDWAKAAAERPATFVVEDGSEVVEHLVRLYESPLALA